MCASPSTHTKQVTCVDVGFHCNFFFFFVGGTWICVWIFLTFLGGGGRGEGLLLNYLFWGWGSFFFNLFLNFFFGGSLLLYVQHSLIHSHNFLCVLGGV